MIDYISLLLVAGISALLVITGLKKQPGIGILATIVLIALAMWLRQQSLTSIGFAFPANPLTTILLGLVLAVVIQMLAVAVIEPITERLTHSAHDYSMLDGVKGNWKAFLQWMLVVWILVAVLEEGIYRGFLMTEVAKVVGSGPIAVGFNIVFTSIIFGLSHGYQNRSGILSTGLIGVCLAILFVMSGYNLWLPILTHGFIDTVGIALMALDWDKPVRHFLWKDGIQKPSPTR